MYLLSIPVIFLLRLRRRKKQQKKKKAIMVIDENILFSAGAEIKEYKPTENIFCEGDSPHYYYQIITGEVKLNNYNEEEKNLSKISYQKGRAVENLFCL